MLFLNFKKTEFMLTGSLGDSSSMKKHRCYEQYEIPNKYRLLRNILQRGCPYVQDDFKIALASLKHIWKG